MTEQSSRLGWIILPREAERRWPTLKCKKYLAHIHTSFKVLMAFSNESWSAWTWWERQRNIKSTGNQVRLIHMYIRACHRAVGILTTRPRRTKSARWSFLRAKPSSLAGLRTGARWLRFRVSSHFSMSADCHFESGFNRAGGLTYSVGPSI